MSTPVNFWLYQPQSRFDKARGKTGATIGITGPGAYLTVFDADGKALFSAPQFVGQ